MLTMPGQGFQSDDANRTSRNMAKLEGILAGISGGAATWAALEVAVHTQDKDRTIVVVLPDTGEPHISAWLFRRGQRSMENNRW